MGYLDIDNLYKVPEILEFKTLYASEKIHGTSAHVSWKDNQVGFFAGGESHERFVGLFNADNLKNQFVLLGHASATLYGEACGGKQQGMKHTYGPDLRFIVFDVLLGKTWAAVPDAEGIAKAMNLEFVPYRKVETDLDLLRTERGRPSEVAVRRGIVEPRPREGIVLRPPFECSFSRGGRVIAKYKNDWASERTSKRDTDASPDKVKMLQAAQAVAEEFVTPMRLAHVLGALAVEIPGPWDLSHMAQVIRTMHADIRKECGEEFTPSREVSRAIGTRTARLFKTCLVSR